MTRKKNFFNVLLSSVSFFLVFASLFFFTNCLYLVDGTTKIGGLTLKDFSLICVALLSLVALFSNRLGIKKLLTSSYFIVPLVVIPVLCLASSITAKYTFEQSIWTGLRPQRFFILFPFIYLSLSILIKNKIISPKPIIIACILFALSECSIGFVQFFLRNKVHFLHASISGERGFRLIMASSPIFLGVALLIGEFAESISKKRYFKSGSCLLGLIYLSLFDVILTKYRIYIICFTIGFIACLVLLLKNKKPLLFKKIYPYLVIFLILLVVGGIVYAFLVLFNDGSVVQRINGYYNYMSLFVHYPFTGIGFPSEYNLWSKVIARMSNHINYVDIGLMGFIGLYGLFGFVYYCLFFYMSALFIQKSKNKNYYLLTFTLAFYLSSSLTVVPYFCDQNIIVSCLILAVIEGKDYLFSQKVVELSAIDNTKKHIIMIGPKCVPSRVGGVDVVVERLSKELVNQGNKVTIYTRRKSEQQISIPDLTIKKVFTINTKKLEAIVYSFFATIKALCSKADVLHFHSEGACLFLWMTRFSKKKIVVTVHGLDWKRDKFKGLGTKILLLSEKRIAKFADEIIVLSKSDQTYFLEKYNKETKVIPNGIDKQTILNPNIIKQQYGLEKESYFLFLARIVPEKGLHYLIEAYKKHNFKHKLVIAGGESHSKDYFDEMKKLAEDNKNIIFTGFVQGNTLDELFSNAYLYILPSDIEGMAMSLLEALGHERVCLVSDIPENKVCDENLHFFKKSSVESLEEELLKLDNAKLQFKKGKAFLSWSEVAAETLKVYK